MSQGVTDREIWLRTDEAEDVAGSIRHALRCRDMVANDPQAWKWMALALHAALQGATVCHLVTTAAPLGVVDDKHASRWIKYFEESITDSNVKPPGTYLMNFVDLLKSARKPMSAGDGRAENIIRISDSEIEWLRRFHESVRNQFVHFEPMGWSIDVSGVPAIAVLTARIVTDVLESGWAFRNKDLAWRESLRTSLAALAEQV